MLGVVGKGSPPSPGKEENRVKLFPDMNEQTFEFPPPYPSSYTPIQLKLGTLVGRPGAIIVINFGENLY